MHKIQLEPYKRESERYGRDTMDICEDLFYYSSEFVLDFLSNISIRETDSEDKRWLFALKSTDYLLSLFLFKEKQKLDLISILKENFEEEFFIDKKLKVKLDLKYRDFTNDIENFMTTEDSFYETPTWIKEGFQVKVHDLINRTGLKKIMDLIPSILHMHLNRIFITKNRLNEMVIYNFMYRYNRSRIARKKYNAM